MSTGAPARRSAGVERTSRGQIFLLAVLGAVELVWLAVLAYVLYQLL